MRYISPFKELVLLKKERNVVPPVNDPEPKAAWRFYAGELIVGDPASGTGAANTIDWTVDTSKPELAILYPSAATPLEKAGLGKIFFESPYIDASSGSTSLTAGKSYLVIRGNVTYASKKYYEGSVFSVPSNASRPALTGASSDAIIALDISSFPVSAEPYRYFEGDIIASWYKVMNLVHGDEAEWRSDTWSTGQPEGRNPWTWTR